MTTITPEQRHAIAEAGDRHPELFDPETNKTYFLVTSEWLEGIRAWLRPFEEDWNDPAMDVYDNDELYGPEPTTGQVQLTPTE
jgi:hypothetical protein